MIEKISDLAPNPQNPRKITNKKLRALKKSMEEFGDLSGIIFNRRTGHLIGGHQRLEVFKMISPNLEKYVIEMIDEENGIIWFFGVKFSYREVDWDEVKEKAANIAANKGAGEWDYAILKEMILDLDSMNFDLGLTMFSEGELESVLDLKEPKKKEESEKGLKNKREVICPECSFEFFL